MTSKNAGTSAEFHLGDYNYYEPQDLFAVVTRPLSASVVGEDMAAKSITLIERAPSSIYGLDSGFNLNDRPVTRVTLDYNERGNRLIDNFISRWFYEYVQRIGRRNVPGSEQTLTLDDASMDVMFIEPGSENYISQAWFVKYFRPFSTRGIPGRANYDQDPAIKPCNPPPLVELGVTFTGSVYRGDPIMITAMAMYRNTTFVNGGAGHRQREKFPDCTDLEEAKGVWPQFVEH